MMAMILGSTAGVAQTQIRNVGNKVMKMGTPWKKKPVFSASPKMKAPAADESGAGVVD
jgi:hypothetical protein